MNQKLKLEPYILKRYESNLDVYFFYNLRIDEFWETDYFTGEVVSSLDGQYSREDIVNILLSNNSELSREQLEGYFYKVFDFLIKKGFVSEQ